MNMVKPELKIILDSLLVITMASLTVIVLVVAICLVKRALKGELFE